jgi:hypothetical protein
LRTSHRLYAQFVQTRKGAMKQIVTVIAALLASTQFIQTANARGGGGHSFGRSARISTGTGGTHTIKAHVTKRGTFVAPRRHESERHQTGQLFYQGQCKLKYRKARDEKSTRPALICRARPFLKTVIRVLAFYPKGARIEAYGSNFVVASAENSSSKTP